MSRLGFPARHRRVRAAAVLALLLLCLASVAGAEAADPYMRGTLRWEGRERSYLVHAPASPAGRLPLVLILHGAGDNAASFAAETEFAGPADRAGMLVVYPDGTGANPDKHYWNATFCCGPAVTDKVDDVGFITALVDHLAGAFPVDPNRVYATGMSNGAMLAYQLAAARPDRFAAIAAVSGTIGGTSRDGAPFIIPTPERPVSVLIIHGYMDPYVLFYGGASRRLNNPKRTNRGVGEALAFWALADGCLPVGERLEAVPGKLARVTMPECRAGRAVALWEIADGEHAWPEGDIFPDPAGGLRSAAAEILAFFAAQGGGGE